MAIDVDDRRKSFRVRHPVTGVWRLRQLRRRKAAGRDVTNHVLLLYTRDVIAIVVCMSVLVSLIVIGAPCPLTVYNLSVLVSSRLCSSPNLVHLPARELASPSLESGHSSDIRP